MAMDHTDDNVRLHVIAELRAKLDEYLREKVNQVGNSLINDLCLTSSNRLDSLSTELLLELAPHDGNTLIGLLSDKDTDETLIREYMMYFPSSRAIMDVRRALGRENLVTDVDEERRGIMAAMRVSHASYIINRKRGTFDDPAPEPEAFVSAGTARLAVANPDREQDIINYIAERDLVGDEVDLTLLHEYFDAPSGLARGTL